MTLAPIGAGDWRCLRIPAWARDDQGIRDHADTLALRSSLAEIDIWRRRYLAHIEGCMPPDRRDKRISDAGELRRYRDPAWWRRGLRRMIGRRGELYERAFGSVGAAAPYVSNWFFARWREQRQAGRVAVASMVAESDDGDEVPLEACIAASTANPELRRKELMARARGMGELADRAGWACMLITVTVPSRMHATPGNNRYDSTSPDCAQRYLTGVWARTRAAWARAGIRTHGLRAAEPHRDGTPHWHLAVWVPGEDMAAAYETLERYALADSPDEPGARAHRITMTVADSVRAVGYVAKYVAKNVDGAYLATDQASGLPAGDGAARARAWASCWGIRQFQAWGQAPVGIWRELRRANGAPVVPWGEIWKAADAGEWADYCLEFSGLQPKPLKVWSGKPGRYGDPVGDQVRGVVTTAHELWTRLKNWSIVYRPGGCGLGLVSITVREVKNHGLSAGTPIEDAPTNPSRGARGRGGDAYATPHVQDRPGGACVRPYNDSS